MDGGLKDESRMYSVRGCVGVALTVRTTRNLEGDAVKECKADSRSGSIALIDAIREAMSAIALITRSCAVGSLELNRSRHSEAQAEAQPHTPTIRDLTSQSLSFVFHDKQIYRLQRNKSHAPNSSNTCRTVDEKSTNFQDLT
jgi:hypothetical protein